jgi:leucyl/phenylalanyl-tRNA--protein transferase
VTAAASHHVFDGVWDPGAAPPPGDAPVAFGGTLAPADLLAAAARGMFPFPTATAGAEVMNELLYADLVGCGAIRLIGAGVAPFSLAWWSPNPRPVLTLPSIHLGHGFTKVLCRRRRWTTTVNRAFEPVLQGCREGRTPVWLTAELVDSMIDLHRRGWYHSVEVWDADALVGGAIGLGWGGVLSADTMFHHDSGASQIALAELCVRLAGAGVATLDLQWDSPHVRQFGAVLIERAEYLRLAAAGSEPIVLDGERRTVEELLGRLRGR